MPEPVAQTKVDWAIVGSRDLVDGSFMIIATKRIQSGELESEMINESEALGHWWDRTSRLLPPPEWEYRLKLIMSEYTIIVGPDYETCLRNLFKTWSPTPEHTEIEPTRRAIHDHR